MATFRHEIQALRALAVLLVVVFHLWPNRLTGGYVGVDVFFVISGYLITGHLLRELGSTGRIQFPKFWARRIRRLLPAAAVVLAATVVATALFLPQRLWQETSVQIGASALGIENWVLAASAVDYFGADNAPTAVQHYWSLSVEEQFYLFWPVMLGAVYLLARRRPEFVRVRIVAGVMAIVFLGSFVWSVISTETSPTTAYFSTFTHGWEFAVGGLLALSAKSLEASRWHRMTRTRALVSWTGVAAIVGSAVLLTGASSFPGWIAIWPAAGTVLVIAAGTSASRIHRPLLMESKAVQFIGGTSYSTYLWHWPLIVILPFVLGRDLGFWTKVAVLVVSVALGWLTKRFVEDPARMSRALNHRTWINYTVAASTALVLVLSVSVVWSSAAGQAQAAQLEAREKIDTALGGDGCFGAAAMDRLDDCAHPFTVDPVFGADFAADDWGAIAGVTKDGTMPDKSRCVDFSGDGAGYLECEVGDPNAATTMAIVGDSHALALTEPFVRIAEAHGWRVRVFLKNSCTASMPMHYASADDKSDCNRWRALVAEQIRADDSIDTVVTTGFTRGEPEEIFVGTQEDLVRGYAELWSGWAAAGKRVLVVSDVPLTTGEDVPECVAASAGVNDPCAVTRGAALEDDPVVDAVTAAASDRVSLLDLTSAFCDEETCHSVVGGLIAYRDPHHLSATFALTLIPRLEAALVRP